MVLGGVLPVHGDFPDDIEFQGNKYVSSRDPKPHATKHRVHRFIAKTRLEREKNTRLEIGQWAACLLSSFKNQKNFLISLFFFF